MDILQRRIDERLNQLFKFKKVGDWYRSGVCPKCNQKELYTHAITPKVVKCGRINKCTYEEHVRDICEELFKDWSEDFPKTPQNPNASADAYMQHARGFDITSFKSLYTQELYRDRENHKLVTATVRFELAPKVYWERFIDRPERFGRMKANFIGQWKGLSWTVHNLDELCNAGSIWLTEGIFNSIALSQSDLISISTMNSANYPNKILQQIATRCEELEKDRPRLVWALDNDKAGKKYLPKQIEQSIEDGWLCTAALPIAGKDWNDLFQSNQLTKKHQDKYIHYGKLQIAKTAEEAGLLIYSFYNIAKFYFNHAFRTYWWELDYKKFNAVLEATDQEQGSILSEEEKKHRALKNSSSVVEICNAQLKPLYFQRNEITDESWYYVHIQSPFNEVKATFTPEHISSRSKFKPRVLGVLSGALWTGSDQQLELFVKREFENLREVKTIDFVGYSKEHDVYIFDQFAVQKGQVIPKNEHDYFKTNKKEIKTLASTPVIHLNPKQDFKPTWWRDYYDLNGETGLIILAWWTGSYFAEQIRAMHSSYPFFEFVGQAGSGKSTLIEMLWKFSGRESYEGFDPNKSTSVAIYRNFAQTSNMPIVLIEGDRNDQQSAQKAKFSWDELKDAFNGRAIRSKGLKTAGNETYEPPFRAAVLISQNTPIQASEAILSRTLHISVDIKGHSLEKKNIATRLSQMPLDEACTYMTFCLKNENKILEIYSNNLKKIEAEFHAKGITHVRIALCHAQVSAMIDALAEHVFKNQISATEIQNAKTMLENMARRRVDEIGMDHMFVQQFWDAYEYLNSIRTSHFHLNHYDPTEAHIAINLNEVYKVAARNFQALPDVNEMRNLLRTSKRYKFVEANKPVRSNKFPADDAKNLGDHTNVNPLQSERIIKCWIFTNPNQVKQPGTKK
ncbi:toprim domain-containing protein [Acinetobacter sp. NIPH 1852]|uniref:toprim domain-containing protein n=1 Tax=Acinetobacter sp. NIPH 1852 TaxID=2923428 RepID=UPI001F4B60CB|nr:toprim domain-containing protein [Acinetobacter sp. NIPH 1852]MCH7306584.1 toprim domain-containing protein [Acinetobacter sp. NIPH 1852]